jgi:hypothetical protein
VPGSLGVVQDDGQIPYTPEALQTKKANAEHWIDRDPELKCYLPGIPRAMYMPYPFQITQSTNKIHMAFEFTNTARTVHLDKVEGPPDDSWMGHSVGRWDGDTLVVDVTNFPAGTVNYRGAGGSLHVIERFRRVDANTVRYDVTVEDPATFARPWTARLSLKKDDRLAQVPEYACHEGNYAMTNILSAARSQEKAQR